MPAPRASLESPPTYSERRRATGALGERAAAEHLRRLGLEILASNHRTPAGEIDLIARGPKVIVFAEVKTTRCAAPGLREEALRLALERVLGAQQRRIRRAAAGWLGAQPPRVRAGCELRFDAIAVVLDPLGALVALDHVEGAF